MNRSGGIHSKDPMGGFRMVSRNGGRGHMQRLGDTAAHTVLLLTGVLSMLGFILIRLPRAEDSLLSADGPAYFSYLRSVVFDGDLDFWNEYEHLGYCVEANTPTGFECHLPWVQNPTSTGLVGNPLSVGTPLLWAPFYLAGHGLSVVAHIAGFLESVDGYGYAYESAISIGTIAYVAAGCFLTYRLCRRYFCSYSSLLAVLGVFLASSLLHYTVAAPYMSHGVSFFAVALFLFLWHPPRSRTYGEWVLLGLTAGLMALVRTQNLLYLTVVGVEVIQAIRAAGEDRGAATLQGYVSGGLVAALAGAIVFAPQMLVWNILYGSPITFPQPSGYFDWLHPDLLEYLFAPRPGLYTWTPIMAFATLGFVFLWRRDRNVTAALLVSLALQWYVNSAIADFTEHYEYAFGARRIISTTSIFMLGLAALAETARERFRRGRVATFAAVAALVSWNFLSELQYSWGFLPRNQAISLHQLTVGKFEMLLELIARVINLS